MELVTGRLTPDEYEAEVAAVVEHFIAAEIDSVAVTFGGGCDFSQVNPMEPVIVAPMMLAGFIDDLEEREAYWMGASDLHLASDDGMLTYLLCEALDIHFYSDDESVLAKVRGRWSVRYADAYEQDNELRRRRRLRGGPWHSFEEGKD